MDKTALGTNPSKPLQPKRPPYATTTRQLQKPSRPPTPPTALRAFVCGKSRSQTSSRFSSTKTPGGLRLQVLNGGGVLVIRGVALL
jgi:hypothetical protein